MSLLNTERYILTILSAADSEMYGLDIVKASQGAIARGTVYVSLRRLEEAGYVASRLEYEATTDTPIPRRLYSITQQGRRLPGREAVRVMRLVMAD